MIDPKDVDEIKTRLGKTEDLVAEVYSDIKELNSLINMYDKTSKLDFEDATIKVKDENIPVSKSLSSTDLKSYVITSTETQYTKTLDHAKEILIKLGL